VQPIVRAKSREKDEIVTPFGVKPPLTAMTHSATAQTVATTFSRSTEPFNFTTYHRIICNSTKCLNENSFQGSQSVYVYAKVVKLTKRSFIGAPFAF